MANAFGTRVHKIARWCVVLLVDTHIHVCNVRSSVPDGHGSSHSGQRIEVKKVVSDWTLVFSEDYGRDSDPAVDTPGLESAVMAVFGHRFHAVDRDSWHHVVVCPDWHIRRIPGVIAVQRHQHSHVHLSGRIGAALYFHRPFLGCEGVLRVGGRYRTLVSVPMVLKCRHGYHVERCCHFLFLGGRSPIQLY